LKSYYLFRLFLKGVTFAYQKAVYSHSLWLVAPAVGTLSRFYVRNYQTYKLLMILMSNHNQGWIEKLEAGILIMGAMRL